MSTPRPPVRLRPFSHSAMNRATLAIALAFGMLMAAVSRASDTATVADVATVNESAALPQPSAADPYVLLDGIRKLFVGPPKLSPEELYERVAPSVVTIYATGENHELTGTGSGFFVDESLLNDRHDRPEGDEQYRAHLRDEDGIRGAYVLTNYHVIESATFAEIALFNGDRGVVWHVIAEDKELDLAVLSVTVPASLSVDGIPLAPNDPPVMTTVYAIGSPKGLQGSASEGKVSAYREIFGDDHWLQTTAPISPGSSGGPLLLDDGSLVGITTLSHVEGQNLNFAIPVSAIRTFLSTGLFQRRDIAVGASLRWHEQIAFDQLTSAIESSQYTDAEKRALENLIRLRHAIDSGAAAQPDGGLLALIWESASAESLPKEFEYLRHYLIGKRNVAAAMQALPESLSQNHRGLAHFAESSEQNVPVPLSADAPTEADQIRYRVSPHATAANYHLVEATKLRSDFSPTYEQLYQHHRLSGNRADALLTADTLVKIMPRCAEALAMRAECYRVLGQPASARQDLEAATKLSPANGNLHYRLANVLVEAGEYQEAIESYEAALACDPPDLRLALHYQLGIAYRKAGSVEKALTAFTTAKALGWSADACDSQIAGCRPRQAAPGAGSGDPRTTEDVPSREHELTVYVTKSGTKYHCEDCQHLTRSKLPIALSHAAGIYEPCSHCRPPTLRTTDPDSANVAVSQHPGPRD